MHGRKREDENAPGESAEERQRRADKIAKYNAAKAQLLSMRSARQYDGASYALSGKLIELNPDFYTLFNFRKEIVQHMWTQDPSSKASLSTGELDLSFRALLKNPKCYSAWHHRLWVLDEGEADPKEEMKLCEKMLTMDARNFHCWNYRRAVSARARASACSEFAFTSLHIGLNFSNYSAWHYRSVLIPRMYNARVMHANGDPQRQKQRKQQYEQLLDKEFDLVHQAFYTEPEDQSGWLYHRWLLGRTLLPSPSSSASSSSSDASTSALPILGISLGTHLFPQQQPGGGEQQEADDTTQQLENEDSHADSELTPAEAAASSAPALSPCERHLQVFTRELAAVEELLTIEENCKWALLTAAILQAGCVAARKAVRDEAASAGARADAGVVAAAAAAAAADGESASRIESIFQQLTELDPMRRNYYKDVRARFLSQ